jgi:hypothetical protein
MILTGILFSGFCNSFFDCLDEDFLESLDDDLLISSLLFYSFLGICLKFAIS